MGNGSTNFAPVATGERERTIRLAIPDHGGYINGERVPITVDAGVAFLENRFRSNGNGAMISSWEGLLSGLRAAAISAGNEPGRVDRALALVADAGLGEALRKYKTTLTACGVR